MSSKVIGSNEQQNSKITRRLAMYRLGLWLLPLIVLLTVSSTTLAQSRTAEACFADDGPDRAICIVMIGAMRGMAASEQADPSCPVSDPHDLKISYAVIDWIRSRPERKDEDLGDLIREGLMEVDPCTRGPLTSD